jgi:hypothetical protein
MEGQTARSRHFQRVGHVEIVCTGFSPILQGMGTRAPHGENDPEECDRVRATTAGAARAKLEQI